MTGRSGSRKDPSPWHAYQAHEPSNALADEPTLSKWRVKARTLAKQAGALTSCDLCKRPVNKYGHVWLKTPNAWRAPRIKRNICNSCYEGLKTYLQMLETQGNRDHLPPEDYEVSQGTVTDDATE